MSSSASSAARAATSERGILFTLAGVQFTHIMDFMIMMPLGAGLMRVFNISPTQFSYLVAAYGLAAAITGFAGGFFIDRLDRKRALLWLYAGFGLATLGCAFAPTFHWLLAARVAAGAFGGVAGSIVMAIVSDVIPPERRGRGMAVVMSAFPLASVIGIPTGLILVDMFEWHAPFLMLAGLSVPIWFVASRFLPALPPSPIKTHPVRQMWEIMTHGIHLRGFMVTAALVFAGASVVPFMSPSLVANTGLSESQLKFVYLFGGAATFITTSFFGRLTDRHDKIHVLAGVTVFSIATAIVVTHLGPTPIWLTLIVTTVFFVTMAGRFTPTMAMISNAVEQRYRGGFMSVNSAVQQAAGGLANIVAGMLITREATSGRLIGYPRVGWIAVSAFILTVVLAWRLRSIAPHASRPGHTAITPIVAE
ncbi:MFS transporter [Rariglobus hedericola]|uniref:MFS transporter n=1 Tax=Rariglobus hedericola TaxID=2597822 RepID=A0A556QK00_9BACT|nr:MFS transporter [Rariglobus hedericola]TSJ76974.1 MFS transporter [Rariglobus hedericola]